MPNGNSSVWKVTTVILVVAVVVLGAFIIKAKHHAPAPVAVSADSENPSAEPTSPEAVSPSGAAQPVADQDLKNKIQDYIRNTMNIPSGVTITVKDIKASKLAGLKEGEIEFAQGENSQKGEFFLSQDGRYLIMGKMMDLSVDPFKDVISKISLKDQPYEGGKNAKVVIVEYSDFQCPFCSRAHDTVTGQVMKEYGDKVKLVFKNFPLTNIHPWAQDAAIAGECASKQDNDGFWKFANLIFKNQKEINASNLKEKLSSYAKDAGLNVKKFEGCFDKKETNAEVKADMTEAGTLEVSSTPTFFINGRKLSGARPFEQFKEAIDAELNKS